MNRVINVSFPRSGHAFLRSLLQKCFEQDFIFYEPYHNSVVSKRPNVTINDANWIKTHDFELLGRSVLLDKFPTREKYLIQIRKPLDSIVSWYELYLKNHKNIPDSKSTWDNFLETKLIYWKSFYDTWVRNISNDCYLVKYDDLYNCTLKVLSNIIEFVDSTRSFSNDKLEEIIKSIPFFQFADEPNSIKTNKRNIAEFKYYDPTKFNTVKLDLENNYPLHCE